VHSIKISCFQYFIMSIVCDVCIVGGGISGLYMAYELLNENPSSKVCIFEKDAIFGGRFRDHRFAQAPNIDVGKNKVYFYLQSYLLHISYDLLQANQINQSSNNTQMRSQCDS